MSLKRQCIKHRLFFFKMFMFTGNCLCDEDFGAADCSQDLRDPPYVYAVNRDSGGLCDERDCLEVNINGDMFLDERGLTCKFTRFQVCFC